MQKNYYSMLNHLHKNKLFDFYNKKLNQSNNYEEIEWVRADILDIDALDSIFKGIEKVIHCAALVSFHKLDFNRCMSINRTGTANVVNLCLSNGIKKLCYISSTAGFIPREAMRL